VRALVLLLLFSCGSSEKANSDGGSTGAPRADDASADSTPCMIDGDCAPGEACTGASPGVAGSGLCAARRDPGIAMECLAP
jgi:hypothetical protein